MIAPDPPFGEPGDEIRRHSHHSTQSGSRRSSNHSNRSNHTQPPPPHHNPTAVDPSVIRFGGISHPASAASMASVGSGANESQATIPPLENAPAHQPHNPALSGIHEENEDDEEPAHHPAPAPRPRETEDSNHIEPHDRTDHIHSLRDTITRNRQFPRALSRSHPSQRARNRNSNTASTQGRDSRRDDQHPRRAEHSRGHTIEDLSMSRHSRMGTGPPGPRIVHGPHENEASLGPSDETSRLRDSQNRMRMDRMGGGRMRGLMISED